jgi:16S rRNA (uracil1498-N3)-methyltransferase
MAGKRFARLTPGLLRRGFLFLDGGFENRQRRRHRRHADDFLRLRNRIVDVVDGQSQHAIHEGVEFIEHLTGGLQGCRFLPWRLFRARHGFLAGESLLTTPKFSPRRESGRIVPEVSERFYLNWPLTPGPVEMSGPEVRHLATVCRLRAGDELCLFNGDGNEYPARVLEVSKKTVLLEILSVGEPQRELNFNLEIAAPLPKGPRAPFLIEKLTELGVTSFVPVITRRSIVQPGEGKIDKLQRHVIEASKQCGRNVLMKIVEPTAWPDYCSTKETNELRVLANLSAQAPDIEWRNVNSGTVRCAIGPEGGFTQEEIELANANGWQALNLGPRILRIETAALVMATRMIVNSIK